LNLKNKQTPTINVGNVQVSIERFYITEFRVLEEQWLQLEKFAETFFFLSWKWIGCWLKAVAKSENIYLVKAQKNNLIVGLGLFVEQNIIRHHIIPSKQWYLHRTGKEEKDQIWIENNGFLLSESGKDVINSAMWDYLLSQKSNIDEYIVNVAKKSSFDHLTINNKKYSRINENPEIGYKIPLKDLASLDDYLTTLSKNTRRQYNQSLRHLSKQGDIEFSIIENECDQLELLENAKHWHIEKWNKTPTPSGFSNDEFNLFHNKIITTTHPSAKTIMAKLTLNNNLLGCLYCLTHENKVYFYSSCFKPFTDNKIKLGLIMHIRMIEWLISESTNYSEYDFLAGDARYKSSLSTVKDEYLKFTFQRNAMKFWIERHLTKFYNSIFN
jgi:hypothetical protein